MASKWHDRDARRPIADHVTLHQRAVPISAARGLERDPQGLVLLRGNRRPHTFAVAATTSQWREANPKVYAAVLAAIAEANQFIASNPRRTAEIFQTIENVKMPVEDIERMIRDPEFSFEPAPMNVLKIYYFMQRVGTLKTKPEKWTDLFFPEAHGLKGS